MYNLPFTDIYDLLNKVEKIKAAHITSRDQLMASLKQILPSDAIFEKSLQNTEFGLMIGIDRIPDMEEFKRTMDESRKIIDLTYLENGVTGFDE